MASALLWLGVLGGAAAPAGASPISLVLGQGEAFSLLGHSCGGIQEKTYATGFGVDGYPTGDVYMQTRCGGSGRGGGYKTTTYSAWASVRWNWFGEVLSFARLEGPAQENTSFSAEDAYGDHEYNSGTAAFLETGSPPLQPPASPTGVTAYLVVAVDPEQPTPDQFQVSWTPAPATSRLLTSSTVTATPVGSSAPTLTTNVSGGATSALIGPLVRNTTYSITVTSTDDEGASQPSAPIEATDTHTGEGGGGGATPPDFGRCVKVPAGTGAFATATCTQETSAGGAYEWFPGVTAGGFTGSLKAGTTAVLESTGGAPVTCTGGSMEGAVTGSKTLGSVVLALTGCTSASGACSSPGVAGGELRTGALQGALGIERVTVAAGREVEHVAVVLGAGDEEPFLEYACGAEPTVTVNGSVIAPVVSNRMLRLRTLKLTQKLGRQKPEALEGGLPQVLLSSLGEQVGIGLTATLTSEEPVEINTTV